MELYHPPTEDLVFVLHDVFDVSQTLPDLNQELLVAFLDEAARFATEYLVPLRRSADIEGCHFADGKVTTPQGFRAAYAAYRETGWPSLTVKKDWGGQGMPRVLGSAVSEILSAANLSFADYLGTSDAVMLLQRHGSSELIERYGAALTHGEILSTQCMTEPHCGTDLGLARTRATPIEQNRYLLTGRKIFISGGAQDMTENILHFVLARLPDAPVGSKGLSLFLVPSVLPDSQQRNNVLVTGIENKMGYRGSATCSVSFEDAQGWLLGAPHRGLYAMFEMVNPYRLWVGQQGIAQAELAYQLAINYAKQRKQGRAVGSTTPQGQADSILMHADVRRSLMTTRSFVEAARAALLWTVLQLDIADSAPDAQQRDEANLLGDLLTPVLKAVCSDLGFDSVNRCMDVFGGHGYIRETGIEQVVRDVRIAQIHEGSNGINAADFLGRMVPQQEQRALKLFFERLHSSLTSFESPPDTAPYVSLLKEAVAKFMEVTQQLLPRTAADRRLVGAVGTAYQRAFGLIFLGWMSVLLLDKARPYKTQVNNRYAIKHSNCQVFFMYLFPEVTSSLQIVTHSAEPLFPAENYFNA
jgi:alkylation response protein AidB-like acyl-CoA dehydrogenase